MTLKPRKNNLLTKKVIYTNLNIVDAVNLANSTNANITRPEMLESGAFVVPTNKENENCVIYTDFDTSRKYVMWSPTLGDLIATDWVVFYFEGV
ncbi:MW1434 family type I TA system toxin [Erysipelothrix anatis]|uniref:Thoeris anti-defense Tad2 family protein n=1 Tax=Erysipelothrix anatis TaxID=2683713 RepID=UPI00135C400E|nr:hypothetical protein [Erysipelothrix anatis]